jgi:hypothetical protein
MKKTPQNLTSFVVVIVVMFLLAIGLVILISTLQAYFPGM